MLIPISACVGLAALSLLLPSEPSYDPWAWLVWGREIVHLELDTEGGPSWKPLPVALLAVVAPLGGDLPVALWVVIARAGALLAVALMLWAVERHLDGRRGHALALGALVCLLRPELFPFLAAYVLWLAWIEPGRRRVVAALLLAIPLAWVVPEWIGSGDPLDGGSQARSEPYWSLSHAERPWLRALERVHNHAGIAVELLALAAVAIALARRRLPVVLLGAAALAEIALFVAMTQAGFSGNPRYALPGLALAAVLAGAGAGL